MYRGVTKRVEESDDNMKQPQKADVDKILAKLRQLAVRMKIAPIEFGYRKNEDESVDILHGGCFYFNGCKKAADYGLLKRSDGKIMCGSTMYVCQFLKMGTGYEWDYSVLKFSEPQCIMRCYMV